MNNLFRMNVVQALEDVLCKDTDIVLVYGPTTTLLSQLHVIVNARAKSNEFRHYEVLLVGLEEMVDRHNTLMIKLLQNRYLLAILAFTCLLVYQFDCILLSIRVR